MPEPIRYAEIPTVTATATAPTTDPSLDKSNKRISKMFGEIAPTYDFLNHFLSLNIDKSWRRRTVRDVPVRDGGPVLDVCTGTGDLALEYRKATQGSVPIIGADFCRPMLERAMTKKSKLTAVDNDGGIDFLEADAQVLPFATDTFEVVTVAFGLRNIQDPMKGLAEMIRVAKPGGRIAILEFSKPRRRLMGAMYTFYFKRILPIIGRIVSRSKDSAYNYLPESVMQFPDGERLAEILRKHGLRDVTFSPLTFGIATLYIGVKGA